MRNCLLSDIARSRNGPPVAPCRGGCDLREKRRRERYILIPSYPNCIISHASPSRERFGIHEKYTRRWHRCRKGNGNREYIEFLRSARMQIRPRQDIFSRATEMYATANVNYGDKKKSIGEPTMG